VDEPDLIAESRRLCSILERELPTFHFPADEATFQTKSGRLVTAKIPSKLEAVAESLAWRGHDFATLASDLFESDRVIPGAVIARSLMETAALMFVVLRKTQRALLNGTLLDLDTFLVRCMSGNRLGKGELDAPSVMTAIETVEKEPGCDSYATFYASLCEFAHPNALGSFYAYSQFHDLSRTTFFGINSGLTKSNDVAFTVVFALEVMIDTLRKLRETIPAVIKLAQSSYPESNAS
jgi:hypothetical protein